MKGILGDGQDVENKSRSDQRTRRGVLRSIGVATGTVVGIGGATHRVSATAIPDALESFQTRGKETVTTHITPTEFRVKRQLVSTDLKERYGRASLVTTETHPRPTDHDDGLPERDLRKDHRSLETYYAKEDEWTKYLTERDKAASEMGPRAVDKPADCPKWYYDNVEGGFELKGPMNLVGECNSGTVDRLVSVLFADRWTDVVIQYNRWAWVPQHTQFEMQHASAATHSAGFLGRRHVKFWKTGDQYFTGAAHEDDAFPHEVASYTAAEFEIVGIFNDSSDCSSNKNAYDFDNSGYGDHGGYASYIYYNY